MHAWNTPAEWWLPGLWVVRGGLVVLFAAALWHKARAPQAFFSAVAQYRLLPPALAVTGAGCVLLAECVVLAGLLAWPLPPAGFAWGAAALLTLYGLAMAINLGRGRERIDCGCHGFSGRQHIAGWMVLRNLLLATAAAILALAAQGSEPLPWPPGATIPGIVGATAVLCVLYVAAHHLAANAAALAQHSRGAG